ncbi:aspartate kinase [Alkalihalobacterium chitinilyticum]|uniref:Aspartokinase n=1 Tax=Alkalihalobacterium chitinilyticum TaxID=2980103 RepID=A0ABT5VAS8_9BACI|nr:aspartate kinase [Alkalihalobacterium chitinilyticum]MDE5412380.1 aspartate kinase [Alkalihalobacterium chitinilyticum]
MAIIVQKYGGTSVGSVERIEHVAGRVAKTVAQGHQVVVVVSAMGKTTDQLVKLASEISDKPSKREMDMLLTTGEQITISLLAMALQKRGLGATSYTGWQAGIVTEDSHSNARILDIQTEKIQSQLSLGNVVIVAGFQGATHDGEITTLGRGGSDTTAVALAAALKADRCDIYTDVTGVYTTDPRFISGARKLHSISYDEMLEMANLGAGVLHPRAVEFAKNYQVKLMVASSMVEEVGTLIEEEVSMEQNLIVRGIAFENDVTKITVSGLPNQIETLSNVFSLLSEHGINVDIIIQNQTAEEKTSISFSTSRSSLEEALEVLDNHKEQLQFTELTHEGDLAKVSIIGSGMVSNPGVAAQMFKILAENEILIKMVSTSEIKVSALVEEEIMVPAVEALHRAFQLEEQEVTV